MWKHFKSLPPDTRNEIVGSAAIMALVSLAILIAGAVL